MKSSFGYGKYGHQQCFSYEKQGNFQGNNRGSVGGKWKTNQASSTYSKKTDVQAASASVVSKGNIKDINIKGKHDLRQLSKDPSFKPKVLVRGSTSKLNSSSECNEPIPTTNSFSVLVDESMVVDDNGKNKDKSNVEDCESSWSDLKSEVDILLEAGIYPFKLDRLDRTLSQMDYFYQNCHKYHLDPSYEDEDVESECDGVAMCMRPEFDMDAAIDMENDDQVIRLLRDDNYSLCCLLETHVKKKKLASICSRILGRWEWASNNSSSFSGTRIIVGWDPNCINVMVMEQSDQAIHYFVEPLNGDMGFHCSFVCAHIHIVDRRSLWKSLQKYKRSIRDSPWIILGDLNTTLDSFKKSTGGSKITTAMSDFRDCVCEIKVNDIAMSDINFTWNKSPGKVGGLLKKLDRVMGNVAFMSFFPTYFAHFLPFMTSDHSPAVFAIPEVAKPKPKPFKFHNYLTGKDGFIPAVKKVWESKVDGFLMFSLVSKLKMLKKPLRKLNFDQGNLFANVEVLRQELSSIQATMVSNPYSSELREAKLSCLKAFKAALKDEELFLRQKSKIEWLSEGDNNSRYFHNVVKGRINRGRIFVVEDMNGIPYFGPSVGDQFVSHFQSVLGKSYVVLPFNNPDVLFTNKLFVGDASYMVKVISDDENIVGKEFCKAVKDFFVSGKLLKEVNFTVISLVPKLFTPRKVSDYRLIACCNLVFKCISKIMVNRIKGCLNTLVDQNQSAFIPSRQISDNVLLSQELLRGYHRKRGHARCAFKVDIQKAYDSVEWSFLENCLIRFGFHNTMIKWIMECISSTFFSINVNGDLRGFFKGKRGLSQGDPLSPYLFTLVMEVLNLMIKRNISLNPHFKYHWQCKDMKITHLCFADDLMLFYHGNSKSVTILKNALDEFGSVSGLFPSFPKSTVFFGNVRESSKAKILNVMPFSEGKLPVRYLSIPLLSKRLYVNDCSALVDKVKKRILDWKNKSLSFAGRLQLIFSVVGSLQVYWSSMFILLVTISNEVERLMGDFLWNYGDFKRGKARIKWSDVCKPKVKWVHVYKLKGRNSWDISKKEGSSWSWKKIPRCRGKLRKHIVHKIGNGVDTSLWFDNWHAICPLSNFISKRKIYYSGLSLDCKVANVIVDGMWKWPYSLTMEFDGLNMIEPPCLSEVKKDKVLWRTLSRRLKDLSVNTVWHDLRVCSQKTQDLMGVWEKNDNMRCVFCKDVSDSHDHLFFKCDFSSRVWDRLKCMVNMDHERNIRMFQDKSRYVDSLIDLIKDNVRLRVISLSLNDSVQVSMAASLWNFHVDRGLPLWEYCGQVLVFCFWKLPSAGVFAKWVEF
ncbi:RNA-directed DNA polymerase, eukaryota, reverse transcriptase zinc-binding domain protein [Tanacetum coccineum]